MHKIFFSLKRAHQSTLRFSRKLLPKFGLTAARYDLLHALKFRRAYGMSQKYLTRVLGVTGATVSRMLLSLEELGFVRREVCRGDRRCKDVWITSEGFARLQSAYDKVVKPGWVQFAVAWVLGTRAHASLLGARYCVEEMVEIDRHLWSLRRGFADTGSLGYPRSSSSRASYEYTCSIA